MCYPFHFRFWSDMNSLHRIPFIWSPRWCFMLIRCCHCQISHQSAFDSFLSEHAKYRHCQRTATEWLQWKSKSFGGNHLTNRYLFVAYLLTKHLYVSKECQHFARFQTFSLWKSSKTLKTNTSTPNLQNERSNLLIQMECGPPNMNLRMTHHRQQRRSKWIIVIRIHFNLWHCRKSICRQQLKWHLRSWCCTRTVFESILEDITSTPSMLRDDTMIEAKCRFEDFIFFSFLIFVFLTESLQNLRAILHGNGTPDFWSFKMTFFCIDRLARLKPFWWWCLRSQWRLAAKSGTETMQNVREWCHDQNERVWITNTFPGRKLLKNVHEKWLTTSKTV